MVLSLPDSKVLIRATTDNHFGVIIKNNVLDCIFMSF